MLVRVHASTKVPAQELVLEPGLGLGREPELVSSRCTHQARHSPATRQAQAQVMARATVWEYGSGQLGSPCRQRLQPAGSLVS